MTSGSFAFVDGRGVKNTDDVSIDDKIASEAQRLIEKFGKAQIESNILLIQSLIREAAEAIKIFVRHISKGKFKPLGEEISFRSQIDGVSFVGKIDYADVYKIIYVW